MLLATVVRSTVGAVVARFQPSLGVVAIVEDVVARRAEVLVLAAQSEQQVLQARLDRMRATFNAAQEVRSERLRQMNMLRDMAMEQAKHDDEILKKYIAMI